MDAEKRPIDAVGSLLYVGVIIFLVYGLSTIVQSGAIYLVVFGVVLIAYVLYERNRQYPIYNLKLLRSFKYVIGNYSSMVGYFVTFIAAYILSLHLQLVMGVDSRTTGLLLLITPILMVFVSPFAGKLADKHDPRVISAIAMIVINISMVIFLFLKDLPLYWIVIGIALQGIGHGLFSSPNNRFVLTSVGVEDLPDASSFLASIKEIGKLLCTSIFNVICVMYVGNMEVHNNISGLVQSSRMMMILCVALSLSAIVLLFASRLFFERDENLEVLKLIRRYLPKRIVKWYEEA
ncbi:MFS transporter [uncultured Methanobrevibacter sp.]|uniref:MFS transporter n=1 Tax=uncultured Methanobrevibacter sp. TaxID=253161 RepID=UPI0025F5DF99|nr:MFS transporter [uncultured Methanobrevibacter sp.]